MKDYNYKKLRNVGLIGHGATGKTSLVEALLFYTNNTDRLGKVEDGNTVMDYQQEEKSGVWCLKWVALESTMCYHIVRNVKAIPLQKDQEALWACVKYMESEECYIGWFTKRNREA